MRLSFNENTKEVCIEDGARKSLKMQKISVSLFFACQLMQLRDFDNNNISFLDYIAMVLAIAFLIFIYYYFFKVSAKDNIPAKNIIGLV